MKPFVRFLGFEAVGWVVGGLVLGWLAQQAYLSAWLAWVLFGALVLKDLALYPLTRKAYEHGTPHGAAHLIGADVQVETTLAPEGWVRAEGERWRARIAPGGTGSIAAGARARVRDLQGLTLIVEPPAPADGLDPSAERRPAA
jgi:membrane-bound serine protease (ClpP class)